jgi:anaerobic selenocysteine-containing dehydrogenase
VSWDEALDFIVKRMRAVGPEAVGLWTGHDGFTPGGAVTVQMMNRFSNMYGCQTWHPAMICWGLGGFGVGLTGALTAVPGTKGEWPASADSGRSLGV